MLQVGWFAHGNYPGCRKIHIAGKQCPQATHTRSIQPPQETLHLLKIAVKPICAQSAASKSHCISLGSLRSTDTDKGRWKHFTVYSQTITYLQYWDDCLKWCFHRPMSDSKHLPLHGRIHHRLCSALAWQDPNTWQAQRHGRNCYFLASWRFVPAPFQLCGIDKRTLMENKCFVTNPIFFQYYCVPKWWPPRATWHKWLPPSRAGRCKFPML